MGDGCYLCMLREALLGDRAERCYAEGLPLFNPEAAHQERLRQKLKGHETRTPGLSMPGPVSKLPCLNRVRNSATPQSRASPWRPAANP